MADVTYYVALCFVMSDSLRRRRKKAAKRSPSKSRMLSGRADKAAGDAKASAEQPAAAAKAAETAAQPGYLNLTLGWDSDGEAVMLVDGVETARSAGKVLTSVPSRLASRSWRRVHKRAKRSWEASKMVKIETGLNDIAFPS